MSNETTTAAKFALQDLLVGIADGLDSAQLALRDRPPYDAYGRPNTLYQLPYLDFSLQVSSVYEESVTTDNSSLRFLLASSVTNSNSRLEVFSTLSGRFTASMPNEGLPQIVISIEQGTPVLNGTVYDVPLTIEISNVVGEKLVNSLVEFNFDLESTEAFNQTTLTELPDFSTSEGYTDSEGKVSTTVKLPQAAFEADTTFVFIVNTGTVSKSISIQQ